MEDRALNPERASIIGSRGLLSSKLDSVMVLRVRAPLDFNMGVERVCLKSLGSPRRGCLLLIFILNGLIYNEARRFCLRALA